MLTLLYITGSFWFGWLLGRAWPRGKEKPIFLRPVTRYQMTAPVQVAPLDHFGQWATWTHRFITFAEVLAHETGKGPRRLPSYSALSKATGFSWRHFEPYLDLLESGRVIYVERGGMYWTVDKRERRAALASLPYQGASRPPKFDWMRDSGMVRDKRDGVIAA